MRWPITIHRRADRHERLHERPFGEATTASVPITTLGAAITVALDRAALTDATEGSYVIEVGWPYEDE